MKKDKGDFLRKPDSQIYAVRDWICGFVMAAEPFTVEYHQVKCVRKKILVSLFAGIAVASRQRIEQESSGGKLAARTERM